MNETYSHVVEYSADLKRAYLHDEDDEDEHFHVPVALVRQLIAEERITIWRFIGQWNNGYHTYRPTIWVAAWKQEYDLVIDVLQAIPEEKTHALAEINEKTDFWSWNT